MANSPVPRLKDVAKAANVSLAAASRILRGDRGEALTVLSLREQARMHRGPEEGT